MNTYVKCFRKAEPEEILAQLQPLLTEKQFMWQDIISAFQEPLRKRGLEIFVVPDDDTDPNASGDWTYLCITDENLESKGDADKQP